MKARLLPLFVLLAVSTLFSQSFRGGIVGTVTDNSGAVVPGAKVTATNKDTNFSRSVTADDLGNFVIPELPLGEYTVMVEQTGFKAQTITGAQVQTAAATRVDVEMTPGEVQETIEVTAELPLIEMVNNTQGGTITEQQITELPISGRDYTKVLTMVPGATGDGGGATDSPGSFGLFSINGNRGRSNNFLLDGTDMNDGYRNLPAINQAGVFGTPATVLPLDALAEIPVINSAEAEFGRNAGAIVNIVTKSGTNNWHGSLYEYFRNDSLNARNYFNREPDPKDEFQNHQFGFSLGGPIVRDRTFLFFSYEGQREDVGIPSPITVPTQDEIDSLGGPTNPVIAALLDREPWGFALPQSDGDLVATVPATNRVDSLIAKIDHNISEKSLLTARYFFGDSDQSFPLALLGGGIVPGYNTVTPTTVNILSVSFTHTFSPRLLMEIRGGYNRFDEDFFPEDSGFDPNSIGLNTTDDPRSFGLPLIRIDGYANIGATASVPRGRVDTNWQAIGNFSYNTGRHSWKYGYEFRRTVVDAFFNAGYRGVIDFASLGDFLAGMPSGGRQARGNSDRVTFQNNHAFYIQDHFQVTPNFNLSYGLRWDYYGVIGEEHDRFSILDTDPSSGGLHFVDELYPKDLNNFSPRVSFAYDMFGRGNTVLRAGWGVYYDAFSQDFFVGQLPWNTFNPGPVYNPIGDDAVLFSFEPTGTITDGDPVFDASTFFDSDVFTVDQDIATPYVHNFNVNIQQQLGRNNAVEIGYVGSRGRKLFRYRDINQADPATGARPFDSGPFAPSGGTFFYVNQFESTAESNYDSLQVSLRTQRWRGFTSNVNYTWSHSIDTASDGQDYVPNATQPDDSFNPEAERANSNFDQRHNFRWLFTYEFPNGGNRLLDGWALDGVLSLQSGMPFNINYLFEDDFNGSGEFFGRPDVVGDPLEGTNGSTRLVNLGALAAPCEWDGSGCVPGTQHFGNLGRNAFTGPDFRNFDFSIVKNTKLSERFNLQLRADIFNLFNRANLANPLWPNFAVGLFDGGMDDSTPGLLRGSGFVTPLATPDVGLGNPFLGGGGPRQVQLAGRLTF